MLCFSEIIQDCHYFQITVLLVYLPPSPHSLQTNTFQAVLATDGTNSFVIFLYADDMMQWTNEDVPDESVPGAQVGLNPGGGRNGFSLPTSLTQYTLNITTSSNIGKQGVWIFRVDSPQIELPGKPFSNHQHTYILPNLSES